MLSRRALLGSGAALLTAGADILHRQASANTTGADVPSTGATRIDVQFHFSPPFYTEMIKRTKHFSTERWSVEAALSYMDSNRVIAGIMSVSTPGVNFLPAADSVTLARRLNEAAAQVVSEHPTRFGSFATLPMLDVEATLTELTYCLDTLKMDGVCMMSNVDGRYLGDESFAPIFDELNRRKAVVFIHPTDPADYGQLKMAPVVEWPFDTCRAAIDLIYSGTIRRCPNVRIILAHAGGALPIVARRVEEMSVVFSSAKPPIMMDEAIQQIAAFYYDLAISAHENAIDALRGITKLTNVLFACDWPYAPDRSIEMNIKGFQELNLTSDERAAIEHGNAARLFPRLARS